MNAKLLTETEAAEFLGLSVSTLRQSRMNGVRTNRIPCPPFIKLGRAIRYRIDDLNRWIEEHRVDPRAATDLQQGRRHD